VVDGLPDLTPDERLTDLGIRYLEAVTTPDAVGVYRLVLAEGAVMRELADRFWEAGPGRMRSFLATYFRGQTERGTLNLSNPDDAAHQFAGMLLGNFHMPCLLGLRATPGREEIEAHVQAGVRSFLDGCRM